MQDMEERAASTGVSGSFHSQHLHGLESSPVPSPFQILVLVFCEHNTLEFSAVAVFTKWCSSIAAGIANFHFSDLLDTGNLYFFPFPQALVLCVALWVMTALDMGVSTSGDNSDSHTGL